MLAATDTSIALPLKAEVVVFLGSPGELENEREIVREVVKDLNSHLAAFEVQIDLREGGDRSPAGGRPQGAINPDVDACEILMALFWRTVGSLSGEAESGTLEEYERVCERRQETADRWPQPLIWFKKVHDDLAQDPGENYLQVVTFRQSLIDSGTDYFSDFDDLKRFEREVRRRLFQVVVERSGLAAVPESAEGIRGRGPSARPPTPSEPDPRSDPSDRPELSGLVTEGPAALLPQGQARYEAAKLLAESDPAQAAVEFEKLAQETDRLGRHAAVAAESLRRKAADAHASAGDHDAALSALSVVLRSRAWRGSALADGDIRQMREWLPDNRQWVAGAWEAAVKWPEQPEAAQAQLGRIMASQPVGEQVEDLPYWRLIYAELAFRAGDREAVLDAAADADGLSGGPELLLRLLAIDALSLGDMSTARDRYERLLDQLHHQPESLAIATARYGVLLTRDGAVEEASSRFEAAASLWSRVGGATGQVAEMYFAAESGAEINGQWNPGGWERRPMAAAMRGDNADVADARADFHERSGLAARVIGKGFDALRGYWLAWAEHQRAGNLRGQLFVAHLLGELYMHAKRPAEALAMFVAGGREDDAKRAAAQASATDMIAIIRPRGAAWERAASLAAVSSAGRRLDETQTAQLAAWVLDESASDAMAGIGPQLLPRATEAAAALVFTLAEVWRGHLLERLRVLADTPDIRVARSAAEALMLASNAGVSDETDVLASVFVRNGTYAGISWAWLGPRLADHPDARAVVREHVQQDVSALYAWLVSTPEVNDPEVSQLVERHLAQHLQAPAGRDEKGHAVGLLSLEGLGLAARALTDRQLRDQLRQWLTDFATSGQQPQINRASAVNALINMASALEPDQAAASAAALVKVAAGRSEPSAWDDSQEAMTDPFNRFRLGFTAASDYLQAAAIEACAALTARAQRLPDGLTEVVAEAWASSNAQIAASVWDAVARCSLLATPPGLAAALIHPEPDVRAAALHCAAERDRQVLSAAISERLLADDTINVRLELIRAARQLDRQDLLDRLLADPDAYVRAVAAMPPGR